MKKILLASMAMIFTADVALAQVLSITQQRHPGTGQYRINFYSDYGADGVRGGGDDTVRSYTAPNLGLANAHSFSRVLSDAIDFYVGPSVEYRFVDTGTGTAGALTAAQNAINHYLTPVVVSGQNFVPGHYFTRVTEDRYQIYRVDADGTVTNLGDSVQGSKQTVRDAFYSASGFNMPRDTPLHDAVGSSPIRGSSAGVVRSYINQHAPDSARPRDGIESPVTLAPNVAFTTRDEDAFNSGWATSQNDNRGNLGFYDTAIYLVRVHDGSYFAYSANGDRRIYGRLDSGNRRSMQHWIDNHFDDGLPFFVIDEPANWNINAANLINHIRNNAAEARLINRQQQTISTGWAVIGNYEGENRPTTPTAEGYEFDRYRIGERSHDSLTEWGITTGPNAINIGTTLTGDHIWKIDAALEEAYHDGYIDGYQQGYEHGFGDGYEVGFGLGRETN